MPTILIFVKNAELGKVKTRLAATVGDDEALRIYQLLLQHTRQQVKGLDAHRWVWYSNFVAADEWLASDFSKSVQQGADLGQRMQYAFEQAFAAETGPVLIIGSDCAQLTTEILQEAVDQLQNAEVVLGPAEDGGYYLLGMQKFYPTLFDDIQWSTGNVLTRTLEHVNALGLSYAQLPTLSDIDYEEDWQRYHHLIT